MDVISDFESISITCCYEVINVNCLQFFSVCLFVELTRKGEMSCIYSCLIRVWVHLFCTSFMCYYVRSRCSWDRVHHVLDLVLYLLCFIKAPVLNIWIPTFCICNWLRNNPLWSCPFKHRHSQVLFSWKVHPDEAGPATLLFLNGKLWKLKTLLGPKINSTFSYYFKTM